MNSDLSRRKTRLNPRTTKTKKHHLSSSTVSFLSLRHVARTHMSTIGNTPRKRTASSSIAASDRRPAEQQHIHDDDGNDDYHDDEYNLRGQFEDDERFQPQQSQQQRTRRVHYLRTNSAFEAGVMIRSTDNLLLNNNSDKTKVRGAVIMPIHQTSSLLQQQKQQRSASSSCMTMGGLGGVVGGKTFGAGARSSLSTINNTTSATAAAALRPPPPSATSSSCSAAASKMALAAARTTTTTTPSTTIAMTTPRNTRAHSSNGGHQNNNLYQRTSVPTPSGTMSKLTTPFVRSMSSSSNIHNNNNRNLNPTIAAATTTTSRAFSNAPPPPPLTTTSGKRKATGEAEAMISSEFVFPTTRSSLTMAAVKKASDAAAAAAAAAAAKSSFHNNDHFENGNGHWVDGTPTKATVKRKIKKRTKAMEHSSPTTPRKEKREKNKKPLLLETLKPSTTTESAESPDLGGTARFIEDDNDDDATTDDDGDEVKANNRANERSDSGRSEGSCSYNDDDDNDNDDANDTPSQLSTIEPDQNSNTEDGGGRKRKMARGAKPSLSKRRSPSSSCVGKAEDGDDDPRTSPRKIRSSSTQQQRQGKRTPSQSRASKRRTTSPAAKNASDAVPIRKRKDLKETNRDEEGREADHGDGDGIIDVAAREDAKQDLPFDAQHHLQPEAEEEEEIVKSGIFVHTFKCDYCSKQLSIKVDLSARPPPPPSKNRKMSTTFRELQLMQRRAAEAALEIHHRSGECPLVPLRCELANTEILFEIELLKRKFIRNHLIERKRQQQQDGNGVFIGNDDGDDDELTVVENDLLQNPSSANTATFSFPPSFLASLPNPQTCGVICKGSSQMREHQEQHCANRLVKCPAGAIAATSSNTTVTMTTMPCSSGAGVSVGSLSLHLKRCHNDLVQCPHCKNHFDSIKNAAKQRRSDRLSHNNRLTITVAHVDPCSQHTFNLSCSNKKNKKHNNNSGSRSNSVSAVRGGSGGDVDPLSATATAAMLAASVSLSSSFSPSRGAAGGAVSAAGGASLSQSHNVIAIQLSPEEKKRLDDERLERKRLAGHKIHPQRGTSNSNSNASSRLQTPLRSRSTTTAASAAVGNQRTEEKDDDEEDAFINTPFPKTAEYGWFPRHELTGGISDHVRNHCPFKPIPCPIAGCKHCCLSRQTAVTTTTSPSNNKKNNNERSFSYFVETQMLILSNTSGHHDQSQKTPSMAAIARAKTRAGDNNNTQANSNNATSSMTMLPSASPAHLPPLSSARVNDILNIAEAIDAIKTSSQQQQLSLESMATSGGDGDPFSPQPVTTAASATSPTPTIVTATSAAFKGLDRVLTLVANATSSSTGNNEDDDNEANNNPERIMVRIPTAVSSAGGATTAPTGTNVMINNDYDDKKKENVRMMMMMIKRGQVSEHTKTVIKQLEDGVEESLNFVFKTATTAKGEEKRENAIEEGVEEILTNASSSSSPFGIAPPLLNTATLGEAIRSLSALDYDLSVSSTTSPSSPPSCENGERAPSATVQRMRHARHIQKLEEARAASLKAVSNTILTLFMNGQLERRVMEMTNNNKSLGRGKSTTLHVSDEDSEGDDCEGHHAKVTETEFDDSAKMKDDDDAVINPFAAVEADDDELGNENVNDKSSGDTNPVLPPPTHHHDAAVDPIIDFEIPTSKRLSSHGGALSSSVPQEREEKTQLKEGTEKNDGNGETDLKHQKYPRCWCPIDFSSFSASSSANNDITIMTMITMLTRFAETHLEKIVSSTTRERIQRVAVKREEMLMNKHREEKEAAMVKQIESEANTARMMESERKEKETATQRLQIEYADALQAALALLKSSFIAQQALQDEEIVARRNTVEFEEANERTEMMITISKEREKILISSSSFAHGGNDNANETAKEDDDNRGEDEENDVVDHHHSEEDNTSSSGVRSDAFFKPAASSYEMAEEEEEEEEEELEMDDNEDNHNDDSSSAAACNAGTLDSLYDDLIAVQQWLVEIGAICNDERGESSAVGEGTSAVPITFTAAVTETRHHANTGEEGGDHDHVDDDNHNHEIEDSDSLTFPSRRLEAAVAAEEDEVHRSPSTTTSSRKRSSLLMLSRQITPFKEREHKQHTDATIRETARFHYQNLQRRFNYLIVEGAGCRDEEEPENGEWEGEEEEGEEIAPADPSQLWEETLPEAPDASPPSDTSDCYEVHHGDKQREDVIDGTTAEPSLPQPTANDFDHYTNNNNTAEHDNDNDVVHASHDVTPSQSPDPVSPARFERDDHEEPYCFDEAEEGEEVEEKWEEDEEGEFEEEDCDPNDDDNDDEERYRQTLIDNIICLWEGFDADEQQGGDREENPAVELQQDGDIELDDHRITTSRSFIGIKQHLYVLAWRPSKLTVYSPTTTTITTAAPFNCEKQAAIVVANHSENEEEQKEDVFDEDKNSSNEDIRCVADVDEEEEEEEGANREDTTTDNREDADSDHGNDDDENEKIAVSGNVGQDADCDDAVDMTPSNTATAVSGEKDELAEKSVAPLAVAETLGESH